MKWCVGSLVPVLAILESVAQGILIIGPSMMYLSQRYTLVVSNFLDYSVDLSLSLERSEDNNVTLVLPTQIVNVQSNTNKLVDFNVPEVLPYGRYRISFNGKSGFNFHEHVPVMVGSKPIVGLMQLDKPVYVPGDMVNFRVVVLDSDLKPPKNLSYVTVAIKNPNDVTVWQSNNAPLEIGVFEGNFMMSAAPVLGLYKIVVKSDGNQLVSKTFEVQKYVLSGFDVEVYPSIIPLEAHHAVNVTVVAKNVFGEPVQGIINLTLFEVMSNTNVSLTREVNGTAQLTMLFNKHFSLHEDLNEIILNFTFTEQYTNRKQTKSMPVFNHMYRAKMVKKSPELHPGYPFNTTIKIEFHDGSPAANVKCIVQVVGTEENQFERISDENGEIPFQLTPLESDEIVTMTVLVDGQQLLQDDISKADYNIKSSLEISLRSSARINQPIKLKVMCGEDVKILMYYVMAKDIIIDQGFIQVSQRENVNIDIQYSPIMVPRATVIVATISGNTMVYDTVDIVFEEQVNNIHLDIQQNQIQPGGQLDLNIKGRQGSYVALAAYDKRLQEYGSTHELSWKEVEMLYEYLYGIQVDEYDIFTSRGLFALVSTNIKLNSALRRADRSDPSVNPIRYRQYLAESFLWRNLTLQYSDQITLMERIPDTMTTWYITGFAIHPEYGFGIIKQPIEFTTKKSFYIVDHLPYSIKRGDIVELRFTIFSCHRETLIVDVQLFNIHNQLKFVERPFNASSQIKSIVTQPNVGASVSFQVKAKRLGEIVVRVKASNMHDSDAIEKVVRVMPESLLIRASESRLFYSLPYVNESFKISQNFRRFRSADSNKITFKMEPNPLAQVLENLEMERKSLNMPVCALNVALLDLLKGLGQNHSVTEEMKNLLATCYQNQIKIYLEDNVAVSNSIFFTAFFANLMQGTVKYLPEVNETIIYEAFDSIASKQHISGRFEEIGPIVLEDLQTNARESIALTSYVLIAFLENPYAKQNYSEKIENSIEYILRHMNEIRDPLDLAIATYALSLYDSTGETTRHFTEKLLDKRKVEGHMNRPIEFHSILTTVYASLVLVPNEGFNHNELMTILSVVKQRPANNLASVMGKLFGLNAITKLAKFISPVNNEYQITIKSSNRTWTFDVTSRDTGAMILENMPGDAKNIYIDVIGTGVGLFTVEYEYLVDLRNHKRGFGLSLEKLAPESNDDLRLKVCLRYIPELTNVRSNMALVEVNLPNGYIADNNPISMTTGNSSIKLVAKRFGASTVNVYYESVDSKPNCFVVTAYQRSTVSLKLPSYVLVKDLYDPKKTAIEAYNVEQDN